MTSSIRALVGYVLIIMFLCVFPENGRLDLATRLANGIVPLTFFALGSIVIDSLDWIMERISYIMKIRRLQNE